MILWHIGGAILGFRYIFRDPMVDLRFLSLGALLPDLIDKPLGTIVFAESLATGQHVGHSLAFSSILMALVLLLTSRGQRRRRLMAVAIGSLFHLALDAMWTVKETFLWPAFGWGFPPGPEDYWSGLLQRLTSDPWILVQEGIGLVYLLYLWRRARLSDPNRRSELWQTGVVQT